MRRIALAAIVVTGSVAATLGWQTEPTTGASGAALDGSELFRAFGCAACHVGPDSSATSTAYPRLDDAAAWAAGRREGMDAREYLTESIRAPSAFISPGFDAGGPTSAMPDLGLDDAEIAALVDHLLAG
ncbi:MAG: cytochrome c [Actinomycetota bacterium]